MNHSRIVLRLLLLMVLLSRVGVAQKREQGAFSHSSHAFGSGRLLSLPPQNEFAPPPYNFRCSPAPCILPNINISLNGDIAANTRLVVDPNDPKQLLAGAFDFACDPNVSGVLASSDGGNTWIINCLQSLGTGWTGQGDVGVGYDLRGNAYLTGEECCGSALDETVAVEKSSDKGRSWSTPVPAVRNLRGFLISNHSLAVDTNSKSPFANALYVSATQTDLATELTQISVSHSYDGGKTWNTVAVDRPRRVPMYDDFSTMTVGPDGTVYLSWLRCTADAKTHSCADTAAKIELSRSMDGGKTWSTPASMITTHLAPDSEAESCFYNYGCLPNTNIGINEVPAIAVDRSSGSRTGNLYLTYYRWTGSFMKVMLATSEDGGKSWRKKAVVSTGVPNDQFLPWVSVSPAGEVGVSWMDRRNDPGNLTFEAFAAFSRDGGASFGNNVNLSANPSNPLNNGEGGFALTNATVNAWAGRKTFLVNYTDVSLGGDQDFLTGYIH